MTIPILWQHDPEKIIGKIEYDENEKCWIVTFRESINVTHKQFFDTFSCSAIILEDEWPDGIDFDKVDWQNFRIIRKAKIVEFVVGAK